MKLSAISSFIIYQIEKVDFTECYVLFCFPGSPIVFFSQRFAETEAESDLPERLWKACVILFWAEIIFRAVMQDDTAAKCTPVQKWKSNYESFSKHFYEVCYFTKGKVQAYPTISLSFEKVRLSVL